MVDDDKRLQNLISTLRNRYEHHLDEIEGRSGKKSGEFRLTAGQMQLGRDIIAGMGENDPANGVHRESMYFVRPTGTGKTVSGIDFIDGTNTMPSGTPVLGNSALQKRAIVMVPWNFLLNQWEDQLLGEQNEDGTRKPSKWVDRIKPQHVGVYRAADSFEQKLESLNKPIVLITYDSARAILSNGSKDLSPEEIKENTQLRTEQRDALKEAFNPQKFSMLIADEIHDKPRGDVTSKFLKDNYFWKLFFIGGTATKLYKDGKTIGDHLFGGEIPVHETTFREAVNSVPPEIAPMRNVLVEVVLNPNQKGELQQITQAALARARAKGHTDAELDYTENELERIVDITKRDEAAIKLLKIGREPTTNKPYRDMKQIWNCASINHAKHVAEKLNEIMGEGYAVAVHGRMEDGEQNDVLINYKRGDHRAITNCQLLTHAFDDRQAELCMQLVPSRSPNKVMQQGGRVMRLDPKNPNKVANIFTFIYPGIDQMIFGELAGDYIMIPKGFKFQPSAGGEGGKFSEKAWPEVEGLRVHYSKDSINLFAEERRKHRFAKSLPVKPDHMLTVSEMAQEMSPSRASDLKLAHETARLQGRIYEPLEAAYNMRQYRQKSIGLDDSSPAASDIKIAVRGQPFPVSALGYYSHEGKAYFCIENKARVLCRHGMYGKLTAPTPDLLSESNIRGLMGIKEEQFAPLIDKVKEGFLDRQNNMRSVTIKDNKGEEIKFSLDHIGFYQRPGHAEAEFFIKPDALKPLHRLHTGNGNEATENWWNKHQLLPRLKTAQWMNHDDVMEHLKDALANQLGIIKEEAEHRIDALWNKTVTAMRTDPKPRPGEEQVVLIPGMKSGHKYAAHCATKTTFSDGKEHACIRSDQLEWMKYDLGMESVYGTPEEIKKRAGGNGRRSR